MKYFLTSNILSNDKTTLNKKNNFSAILLNEIKFLKSVLFICSDPYSIDATDKFAKEIKIAFQNSELHFENFQSADSRNMSSIEELVKNSDVLILAGGNEVKQLTFFKKIELRKLLTMNKIIIGISAGAINCADRVYVPPEPNEKFSSMKTFTRFNKGLGVTKVNILPHYQNLESDYSRKKAIAKNKIFSESYDRKLYAIGETSFLYGEDGKESIYGEAFIIFNGQEVQISWNESYINLNDL